MFLRLLPALVFLASPSLAKTSLPGKVPPDQTSCSRIFACIGDQVRWFLGRAFGRGEGVLDGSTDDGMACRGTWTNSNALGVGQANMACDENMTADVYYSLQDGETGTGIGHGRTRNGEAVQSWTGTPVLEFLRRHSASAQAMLPCGASDIPIS